MKVAVLTSSRADYSIYFPLLKKLNPQNGFQLTIIAFGTHLSKKHGYTIQKIKEDGFTNIVAIETMPLGDLPKDIAEAQAKTIQAFAPHFAQYSYDVVFALGDRFEMFAAVAAGLPFNVNFAHIHGGETTLGAIDNAYRHSISHMSNWHFVTCSAYKNRLEEILGSSQNIFNVGALSIENLSHLKLYSTEEMVKLFNIDFTKPSILSTFHPETVAFKKNEIYIEEIIQSFKKLNKYQIVVTMPNADTMGNFIREKLQIAAKELSNLILVESFGTLGYLSAMKHCEFLLGNTSSGFVEASYFPKAVINLGHRQDGRLRSAHIFDTEIDCNKILNQVKVIEQLKNNLPHLQEYGSGNTSDLMIEILKNKSFE